MAFCEGTNNFVTGVTLTIKHGSTRIKEHEKTSGHINAANGLIRFERMKSIDNLINNELNTLRLINVKKNQELVKRIINWILLIGRQGIAYRGHSEAIKYFNDTSINHGNLLEILRTASQQDELLKHHLNKLTTSSSQSVNDEKGPKGRGSKITFLSKSTFNKIIHEIGEAMKKIIVDEIKIVGMYALMVDSTKDISGYEQCSIVVRYVNRNTYRVEEKLIGLVRLMDASGEGYLIDIMDYLLKLTINDLRMVGCSFDGASSMRSEMKGLQGRLKELYPDLVYTWCYAHNLNLTVSDSVSCVMSAMNLFGLLETTRNFCAESYKRIVEWEKATADLKGRKKLIRFEHLGKTRWYSKDKALKKIFGTFKEPSTDIFCCLLKFLHQIKTSKSYDSKTSFEASSLLENWLKMENILTAFVFLKIFEILGPFSKYLQTEGLDLMAASIMAESVISKIEKLRDSFKNIKNKAVEFAKAVNGMIDGSEDNDMNFFVEEEIPRQRVRRVKKQFDEKASDEPIEDTWKNYKVHQYLQICDVTIVSLKDRFSGKENELLMREMSFFHPNRFEDVMKAESLNLTFLPRVLKIDSLKLEQELKDFASNFDRFKKLDDLTFATELIEEEPIMKPVDSDVDSDGDDEYCDDEDEYCEQIKSRKCISGKPCNVCLKCCFDFLSKINLHVSAYSNLYYAYEYIMTLPCTQVKCERCFSKLKIIKSRLRSALKQYLCEALLLMNVERELSFQLDIDKIVNSIGNSSIELKRHLIA